MNRRLSRRLSRGLAVVCIALGTVVGVLPAPSGAEAPQATGYWARRLPFQGDAPVEGQSTGAPVRFSSAASPAQEPPTDPTIPIVEGPATTVPLPVPVPTIPVPPITTPPDPGPSSSNPTVPAGGLWVANDPTGAAAISALRYRGDIGAGDLTLRFAPGSTTVGPVVACPALSEFEPVEGGSWADRPAHDCDRMSLSGRRSADGTAMEFTIPQGFVPFGERVLDIVVLPAPGSGDPFSLYFEPPGEDSLVVTQGQELPAPAPELPEIDPATLPTFTTPDVGGDAGAFDVDLPSVPLEAAAAPPAPSELGSGASAPSPIADIFEPFRESRVARIICVLVLLGMGAAFLVFGGQPIRAPRLLGALAGDAAVLVDRSPTGRGIGRFRRERAGTPHRL